MPLTTMLTEWHTKWSRNYNHTAYHIDCQSSSPEIYQMTTKTQTDIPPKLPTEWPTEKLNKGVLNLSDKYLLLRSSTERPSWMPNQEMVRSAITIYIVAFPEQKCSSYRVSMTNQEVSMRHIDWWLTTLPHSSNYIFCHPRVVTLGAIWNSQWQSAESMLTSWSKVKTRSMGYIFLIMPWPILIIV